MPENTINPLISVQLPPSVNNAIENLTDKPTKNAGQTFGDCWFLVFGGISQAAEKRRMKYEHELKQFELELQSKIDAVPEDKRIEPDIQKVCPALENAKYCVGSQELRELFSTLIASSMNVDTAEFVHPSFSEILKQMSPLDAKIIKIIMERDKNPLVNVQQTESEDGFSYIYTNLSDIDIAPYKLVTNSIDNLIRHSLIEVPGDAYYTDDTVYSTITSSPDYQIIASQIEPNKQVDIEKKIIVRTTFGISFYTACINPTCLADKKISP